MKKKMKNKTAPMAQEEGTKNGSANDGWDNRSCSSAGLESQSSSKKNENSQETSKNNEGTSSSATKIGRAISFTDRDESDAERVPQLGSDTCLESMVAPGDLQSTVACGGNVGEKGIEVLIATCWSRASHRLRVSRRPGVFVLESCVLNLRLSLCNKYYY